MEMTNTQPKILLIDACVRPESRTRQLAGYLAHKLSGNVQHLHLADLNLQPLTEQAILERETDGQSPLRALACQFSQADTVIVAAPYWDLSFPALLKTCLEQLAVPGLTFRYDNGIPVGLCQCRSAFYVTTAGGPILSDEYGYGYVKTLFTGLFGIGEVTQIKAEGLDIDGADVNAILDAAKAEIDRLV